MNEGTPAVLVPPRPNLGPEPWPEARVQERLALMVAIGAGVVLLLFVAAWLLRRRRPGGAKPSSGEAGPQPAGDSPRARLLRLVVELRRALRQNFGPSMMARTTEELASDPELREALGDEQFESLVGLLARTDRWKFAPLSQDDPAESLEDEIQVCMALSTSLTSRRPPRT